MTNGKMQLSHIGVIANVIWHQIPPHHQNVELGALVVIPNHVHGVLIINGLATKNLISDNLEIEHALSLPPQPNPKPTKDHWTTPFKNMGENSFLSMIGYYKSAVTKQACRLGFDFQWQSRFHDHIIRVNQSFQRISNYTKNNSVVWQENEFFT